MLNVRTGGLRLAHLQIELAGLEQNLIYIRAQLVGLQEEAQGGLAPTPQGVDQTDVINRHVFVTIQAQSSREVFQGSFVVAEYGMADPQAVEHVDVGFIQGKGAIEFAP